VHHKPSNASCCDVQRLLHAGLGTFIKLLSEEQDKKDHGVSRFLSSLSKFSPGERVCFSAASKNGKEKLEEILENLEATITYTDITEFVIFLSYWGKNPEEIS
jgi:hypothetical protein